MFAIDIIALFLTFIHRTFQEYFVAVFVNDRYGKSVYKLMELSIIRSDNVAYLLFDMNKDAFEVKYFKQKIAEIVSATSEIDPIEHPGKAFELFYIGFFVRQNGILSLGLAQGGDRGRFYGITEICNRCYGWRSWWDFGGFDWESWAAKHKRSSERNDGFHFLHPSDDLLRDTPFPPLLSKLFKNFQDLNESLKQTAEAYDAFFDDLPLNQSSKGDL